MTPPSPVRFEPADENGIAVVVIDQPDSKVNTLNLDLLPAVEALLDQIQDDPKARGIVLTSGKAASFIAGADINMLDKVTTAEEAAALSKVGQDAHKRIAEYPLPIVAAIHGDCLGGGLELALACQARICSTDNATKLALPEVMLGLLPAAGGTVRLPKRVGLANALDMMLTGRNIRPRRALSMGLVDQAVPKNQLLDAAKALARRLADGFGAPRKGTGFAEGLRTFALEGNPFGRMLVFSTARKTVMKQTKGLMPAPLAILDVVAKGRFEAESAAFGELLVSDESRGLRHLFHCITALKKDDGPGTESVEALPVPHVGILGAGLMGAGIATVLADKGVTIRLKDRDAEGIARGIAYVKNVFRKAVKRKRYRTPGFEERMNRVSGGTTYAGFGQAKVIIEAVFEDLDLKRRMLGDIEAHTRNGAIFASNTSSLPIGEIAEMSAHPDRVVGMHFFSPVEKMPLVEIIVTPQTDPVATKTVVALARKMGKHVIVVNDCAGFYTTRALAPYMVESLHLAMEGVPLPMIDLAATSVGFPVGPITLMDEVGIDVGAKVMKVMKQYYGDRMELPEVDIVEQFLSEDRRGKKTNKGFYLYKNGESVTRGGQKVVDPAVQKVLPATSSTWDTAPLAERLRLALINEAAWCLHEGILREPRAGDLGAVMGIGFPPFEGGPFRYCDKVGVAQIVGQMNALVEKHGPRFTPCPLLVERAARGEPFYP